MRYSEMKLTSITNSDTGTSGRLPLAGLLLVQIVIGYEWLASGLSKLIGGDFPGGLAAALDEKSKGAAGWYRSFLEGTVIPHAPAFGYAIEISELLAGLLLMVAAAWAVARYWKKTRPAAGGAHVSARGAP